MTDRTNDKPRIGLVGAGPWARNVHGPGLAAHPDVELAGVWARRPAAADEMAAGIGTPSASTFADLLSTVDAVSFAVPPAVQAPLAVEALHAGKHVILEKPIAATMADANRIADAARAASTATLVMLTLRYADSTRSWLDELQRLGGWRGGNARWLSGTLFEAQNAGSQWRHDNGALLDIGPHLLDLLDAALGEIVEIHAAQRGPADLSHLILGHRSGATSAATMSMRLPIPSMMVGASVFGDHGYRDLPPWPDPADSYHALLTDFTKMIHNGQSEHPCDVRRGVHLQHLITTATELVTASTPTS